MNKTIESFGSGMQGIRFSPEECHEFLGSPGRRVLVKIEGHPPLHRALISLGNGEYYIILSQAVQKNLGKKLSDTLLVEMESDTSEFQFEIPEELQAVLDTDPEAQKVFSTLTDGGKRSLMAWVGQVKSSDKRIDRSLKIARHLRSGKTSIRDMLKSGG